MGSNLNLQNSFESIFKEYFNPLCNFTNQYIHNWEDSREIVQSTFLKIWENREQLTIHTSIKSYLYRATKNAMIDYTRKKGRFEVIDIADWEIKEEIQEEKINDLLIQQEIKKVLTELKPKNRKIFELNKFEGLTYKEIANHLDISERSVEDNIARAIRILKENLNKNQLLNG